MYNGMHTLELTGGGPDNMIVLLGDTVLLQVCGLSGGTSLDLCDVLVRTCFGTWPLQKRNVTFCLHGGSCFCFIVVRLVEKCSSSSWAFFFIGAELASDIMLSWQARYFSAGFMNIVGPMVYTAVFHGVFFVYSLALHAYRTCNRFLHLRRRFFLLFLKSDLESICLKPERTPGGEGQIPI